MFGFGAEPGKSLHQKHHNKHCFALNGENDFPEVESLDRMLATYRQAVKNYNFSKPRHLYNVIRRVLNGVEKEDINQSYQKYTLLLILIEDNIDDMSQVINIIVRASFSPISIAIVGVGNSDFSNMQDFNDALSIFKSSTGQRMDRDIIQFASYKDLENSPTKLAQKILGKIPFQFMSYFEKNKIIPNKAAETKTILPSISSLKAQENFHIRVQNYCSSQIPMNHYKEDNYITDSIIKQNKQGKLDKDVVIFYVILLFIIFGIGLAIFFYFN